MKKYIVLGLAALLSICSIACDSHKESAESAESNPNPLGLDQTIVTKLQEQCEDSPDTCKLPQDVQFELYKSMKTLRDKAKDRCNEHTAELNVKLRVNVNADGKAKFALIEVSDNSSHLNMTIDGSLIHCLKNVVNSVTWPIGYSISGFGGTIWW